MQLAIDIGLIALIGAAMLLLCVELGRSQKNAEPSRDIKYRYKLHIYLVAPEGVPLHEVTHTANSVEYMQDVLNNVAKFRIKRAILMDKGRLSHTMDATGVLRAI